MAEYLDKGFRPSLKKLRLDTDDHKIIHQYRLPYIGHPAPTLNGRKGAAWMGAFNKDREAVVLASTTFPRAQFGSCSQWYIGVMPEDSFHESGNPRRLMMEVAEFIVPDIQLALAAIKEFVRPPDHE